MTPEYHVINTSCHCEPEGRSNLQPDLKVLNDLVDFRTERRLPRSGKTPSLAMTESHHFRLLLPRVCHSDTNCRGWAKSPNLPCIEKLAPPQNFPFMNSADWTISGFGTRAGLQANYSIGCVFPPCPYGANGSYAGVPFLPHVIASPEGEAIFNTGNTCSRV